MSVGDPRETIARLQGRVAQLSDFKNSVTENASAMVQMAEDLATAIQAAQAALEEKQEYEVRLREMALFDPLTEVPNRNSFNIHIQEALNYADRDGTSVALLMLDVDLFKEINDNYGHPVGDQLLVYVASQLVELTRETDTVARLGGDEFAVVLTLLDDDIRCARVAERITEKFANPVTLDGALIKSGISVGISVYPRDGNDVEELISKADKALYMSKSEGRGTYHFFDKKMEQQNRANQMLENDMRLGIVRDEFVLDYQPQVSQIDGGFMAAEALVRWQHPTRGRLMPFDFIRMAETTGLIKDIGNIVLIKACKQCRAWLDEGKSVDFVAVNISPVQFQDDDFVDNVVNILSDVGLEPRNLELEITESLLMENIEEVSNKLMKLHEIGISISVDDFGTGYSSLSYLKNLPIQRLKIDRSFVKDMTHNENDSELTSAIINMGHSLNLQVVAEGVESAPQANELGHKNCDFIQGFLIGKPMDADGFADWLQDFDGETKNGSAAAATGEQGESRH